jgi:hypothetical protein
MSETNRKRKILCKIMGVTCNETIAINADKISMHLLAGAFRGDAVHEHWKMRTGVKIRRP